ncbi:Na+/H+ antiporter subunit B [Pelobacter propionicus]|uniref:Multisubunit sodium/proton antiporter, MrpB subunit n=1 Tax=Pelobacter propionicus (strain DSM 2379 / NBRC 103807 / OttBd1) TaxID=338966 RepID=A1ATZ2_PELPD|nr:Na+/H+ antiporter subunit B [Pelobacter propionicus]ABL00813.1 multisubunit sodium/proton antiporter, MrpB subunit [Pelobacter propionicus DSM 2379]
MYSLILATAIRILLPLMLLFSLFLLLRGHNEPGGGFAGGLVAAAAFALYSLAHGEQEGRRLLRVDPLRLVATGLLMALASGLLSLPMGLPFLTAAWSSVPVPGIGHVGTPLLFDAGVYVLVVGIALLIIFTLMEE